MEIANSKFKYKCLKHPDYKIEFIKVNNLYDSSKHNDLFFCSSCVNQSSTFNQTNYQLIQDIVKNGIDQIIPKWPPVNDNTLINQLIKISTGEDVQLIEAQIEKYFTNLKDSILKQIDVYQKKMIQCAQELPINKIQIINKYQELSKIKDLRSVLVDSRTDINEKEKLCRAIVENRLCEKIKITEQLTSLLNQYQKNLPIFNLESALSIKESILKSISDISLFEYPNIPMQNNSQPIKLDIELLKTDLNDGQNGQEIIKNNNNQYQLTIKKESGYYYNTVSNLILKNELKYLFRIQIQFLKKISGCQIGLIQDSKINQKKGIEDKFSCELFNDTYKQISLIPGSDNGIDKQLKGDRFVLSSENEIEMRVCIKDRILEILDYPQYHYKIGLQDKYKDSLTNSQNLRLCLGMFAINNRMILKEALIVNKFE